MPDRYPVELSQAGKGVAVERSKGWAAHPVAPRKLPHHELAVAPDLYAAGAQRLSLLQSPQQGPVLCDVVCGVADRLADFLNWHAVPQHYDADRRLARIAPRGAVEAHRQLRRAGHQALSR